MKILVLCDMGNNRSVTLAHQLKYLGHDCLTAGVETNTPDTITMLFAWADRVITTAPLQLGVQLFNDPDKVELWNIGPDIYPRPFNKELLAKVKQLIREHPEYAASK